MWGVNIKQKATKLTDSYAQTTVWWLPEEQGRKDEESKGGQIYGDGRRLDFEW